MPLSTAIGGYVWAACFVAYLILRIPHNRRASTDPVRSSRRDALDFGVRKLAQLSGGVIPVIYVATGFPEVANYPLSLPALVLGTAAMLGALWCIFRGHYDLGRAFSGTLEIRESHPLVTAGIYRYVRHPMYLGFLLWAIAQALLLANWIAGPAAFVGWIALFVTRVPREEQMMLETFGDQYAGYMARTARLIPRVY